jgi:hypothetical protein
MTQLILIKITKRRQLMGQSYTSEKNSKRLEFRTCLCCPDSSNFEILNDNSWKGEGFCNKLHIKPKGFPLIPANCPRLPHSPFKNFESSYDTSQLDIFIPIDMIEEDQPDDITTRYHVSPNDVWFQNANFHGKLVYFLSTCSRNTRLFLKKLFGSPEKFMTLNGVSKSGCIAGMSNLPYEKRLKVWNEISNFMTSI